MAKSKIILTERKIQRNLWGLFSNHQYRFVNIQFFSVTGEIADFFSFLWSGYCQEVEIKLSRSDFKADFKKPKHEAIKQGKFKGVANRFYYAVPNGLIKENEIPDYAGLIYVSEFGSLNVIKKAPLLHRLKFDKCGAFNKAYYAYETYTRNKLFS